MMKENDLSEFSMEKDGLKIRIKRGPDGVQQMLTQPAAPAPAAAPEPVAVSMAATPAEDIKHIVSPMVGTFYRAASPDAAPYIEVGAEVNPDTVVCIVEAMKVMNEIKAEMKGVITEALVENAKPIEFGQKLFAVRVK